MTAKDILDCELNWSEEELAGYMEDIGDLEDDDLLDDELEEEEVEDEEDSYFDHDGLDDDNFI